MIHERPIRDNVRVETLTRAASPFILGEGILGYSKLAAPGTPQTWHDWTDDVSAITSSRGGNLNGVTIRNRPGMLTLTIRDVEIDRVAPQFYREQPIRLTHINGTTESRLFTGWVRDVEQHYGGTNPTTRRPRTFVTITAVDAIARHDETTRYGAIPPEGGETLADRVARLRASAAAPIAIPEDDYLDTFDRPIMLGRTVYESSLSNHLTLAANTTGAMWYVDAAGITRYQPRKYDPAGAVEFTTDGTPSGALSAVAYTPASATDTGFNTITAYNKAVTIDPESGAYQNLETEHDLIPGYISLIGKQYAELDTNAEDIDYLGWAIEWVQPNMFGWGSLLGEIRWNAQQDLTRVPELDLGASITAEAFTDTADPWSKYLVIGVEHTITPTRWITTLTVIGAQ